METAEQIAEKADQFTGRTNRAAINRAYRAQDESHLWPIRNAFNVTDRAIRRVQRLARDGGDTQYGLEYAYALEAEMSEIVNNSRNW